MSLKLKESVIRQTTRLAVKHDAVNLGQGFPNERPCLPMITSAVLALLGGTRTSAKELSSWHCQSENMTLKETIANVPHPDHDSLNHYSFPFGTNELRQTISQFYDRMYGAKVSPDELTVTLGATEAISIALRAAVGPGNGVVILQPYHEMYVNQALLFGLHPLILPLKVNHDLLRSATPADASAVWTLDFEELQQLCDSSPVPVKGLVLNTPHNPTGKVFTVEELRRLCDICVARGITIITDEIYDFMIYGGRYEGRRGPHQTILWNWGEDVKKHSILVNSVSKTGSATGWRVGWACASPEMTQYMREIHDTMAMQAPTIFQFATEAMFHLKDEYFLDELPNKYHAQLRMLEGPLREVGFDFARPEGAYYIFAAYDKIPPLANLDSTAASHYLIENVGVAAVPGDAFVSPEHLPESEERYLRFAFCKTPATLSLAVHRLLQWKQSGYQPIHDVAEVQRWL